MYILIQISDYLKERHYRWDFPVTEFSSEFGNQYLVLQTVQVKPIAQIFMLCRVIELQ